jgi:hypothetical protein
VSKGQVLAFSATRYVLMANRINVSLRSTEFCFNAVFAERVPRSEVYTGLPAIELLFLHPALCFK